MPVLVDPAALGAYARFPGELDQDWVERTCHLSPADLDLVRRRADQVTRLGFAVQVVTVRAIGTFLPDPAAVPARVATAVARQLDATDARVLAGYRDLAVRWRHTAEIRTRYGYRDFTAQPGHFLLLAWLYRQAWADDVAPSVLFRAAHRRLLGEQILLPGQSVLARLVAAVRDRAARRLHTRLLVAAPAEMRARLEKLLIVPGGSRRSELDRLRRPPFSPTISGLVNALERLADVRALGAGDLDLSGLPAPRVAALARYADQAWATQLADLGPNVGSRPCWPTPTCWPAAPATTSSTSSTSCSATCNAPRPTAGRNAAPASYATTPGLWPSCTPGCRRCSMVSTTRRRCPGCSTGCAPSGPGSTPRWTPWLP